MLDQNKTQIQQKLQEHALVYPSDIKRPEQQIVGPRVLNLINRAKKLWKPYSKEPASLVKKPDNWRPEKKWTIKLPLLFDWQVLSRVRASCNADPIA